MQVDRERRCDARRTETCIIPIMTSKFGLLAQMLVLTIFTNDESAVMSRKVKAFNVGRIMGFRGKNFREGVGGKVYVVDENRQNTVLIKNFFFDGGHPVCCWTSPLKIHLFVPTYFTVSKSNIVKKVQKNFPKGFKYGFLNW